MKKVLVTGAGGTIGIPVISHLLHNGEYEITALDLKSNRSIKRLKKFKDRVNIVYADINEDRVVKYLVKDHDYIIHLAGVIPPFADIKTDLSKIVDYDGTKNLVKLINEYNPKAFLIFASTTTVYGEVDEDVSISNEPNVLTDDLFALSKLRCEENIKEKLKNYTIFRFPAVLGDLKKESPMYNIPLKSKVEFITASDTALSLVRAVENKTKLNHKIFNVTGGKECRIVFKDFIIKVLQKYGISFRYLISGILVDNNFYSHYYADSDIVQNILNFQTESLEDYFLNIQKNNGKYRRIIPKILAKPFIFFIKRKK